MKWIRNYSLYFAWVIALVAVLGSLYYGEVLSIEPCQLCWYQRMGMFPLALFLGVATFKGNRTIAVYCWPLILFGGLVACFHSLMQIFPSLHVPLLCSETTPCTLAGPIPFLSLLAFLGIGAFISLKKDS